jgi:hypothetical protein
MCALANEKKYELIIQINGRSLARYFNPLILIQSNKKYYRLTIVGLLRGGVNQ